MNRLLAVHEINRISREQYGCNLLALDSTASLWLAEYITKQTGINHYPTISHYRRQQGRHTASPSYGTVCSDCPK